MTANQSASAPVQSYLSGMLLRRILLVALAIGLSMSLIQITRCAAITKNEIDAAGQQLLAVFAGSARQALESNDQLAARQVVSGLLSHPSLRSASLGRPDELPLAEQVRLLQYPAMRYFTDHLFAAEQSFHLEFRSATDDRLVGQLEISLDTARHATAFIHKAATILLTGLLGAVILAAALILLLRSQLTRPLAGLLEGLRRIDPEQPGKHQLDIAPQHRHNELGQWAEQANQLLQNVETACRQRHEAEEIPSALPQTDLLDGLSNRLQLQGKLDGILAQASRRGTGVAVMCIGLDGFKSINERYSFQLGDRVLRLFAQRISSQLSSELDCFAWLGGDQFVLVHSGLDSSYQAAALAQKVFFLLHQPFGLSPEDQDEEGIRLGASMGITLFPGDAQTSELLLQRAEQTMRLSRMTGRNRYQFYIASIDQQLRERREMELDLDNALAGQELFLLYQPQIELATGNMVGTEVLLRWRRKTGELVPPDTFIPLAEQTGAIVKIGEWVLEQACEQLRDWLDIGWQGFRMAVNLSAAQLHHDGLEDVIRRLVSTYRIPPGCLELEVTETSLMQDVETARKQLLALRKLGVAIAIDDFGTGHSSLAYLKRLPLDKIKIDRSFIQDMQGNHEDATIVRAVIQLSQSLQLKVLAEGVENRETERLLVAMGCDEAQGYLYSRPVSCEDLLDNHGFFSD